MSLKDYLGDGLYAIATDAGVWLHANHHEYPTDRIFLEPETYFALQRFMTRWMENQNKEPS